MEQRVKIEVYRSNNGKSPFLSWEARLGRLTRAIISTRLTRLRGGNFGDCKSIRGVRGLYEMRIKYGAGYRIYYGKKGDRLVLLLCGGDKGTQKRDIERAEKMWREYQESLKG